MPEFIFVRGLPGSGKSFLAKQILEFFKNNGQIFSTDDYFCLNPEGVYKFKGSQLKQAHAWNQRRVAAAVKADMQVIIVDNTNTTLAELRSYSTSARKAHDKGYVVHLRESETQWRRNVEECAKRNSHGVPIKAIQRMADRYQDDIEVKDILSQDEHWV